MQNGHPATTGGTVITDLKVIENGNRTLTALSRVLSSAQVTEPGEDRWLISVDRKAWSLMLLAAAAGGDQ